MTVDTATTRGPSTSIHCGRIDDTDGRYRVTVTDYNGRTATEDTETMDDGHYIMAAGRIRHGVMVDRWTGDTVSILSRTRGDDTTRRTR